MEAPYWSDAQRQFLAEKIASDGEWAIVVDQLNESLHEDATSGISVNKSQSTDWLFIGITVSVSIKLLGTGYVDIYALFPGSQKAHPKVRPAFQNVD